MMDSCDLLCLDLEAAEEVRSSLDRDRAVALASRVYSAPLNEPLANAREAGRRAQWDAVRIAIPPRTASRQRPAGRNRPSCLGVGRLTRPVR